MLTEPVRITPRAALWRYKEQATGRRQGEGAAVEGGLGGLNVLAAAAAGQGMVLQQATPGNGQQRIDHYDHGVQVEGGRSTEERARRFVDCQATTSGQGADLVKHMSTPMLVLGTNVVPPGDKIAAAHACEVLNLGLAAGKVRQPG